MPPAAPRHRPPHPDWLECGCAKCVRYRVHRAVVEPGVMRILPGPFLLQFR
jgi:hypothetical protein